MNIEKYYKKKIEVSFKKNNKDAIIYKKNKDYAYMYSLIREYENYHISE